MSLEDLKGDISKQKEIMREVDALSNQLRKAKTQEEKNMISSQMDILKKELQETSGKSMDTLGSKGIVRPLTQKEKTQETADEKPLKKEKTKRERLRISRKQRMYTELEKETLKRLKKKGIQKKEVKKKRHSKYVDLANRYFARRTKKLIKERSFENIERSIIKSKLPFIPSSYISVLLFTVVVSIFVAIFLFLFFLFFSVKPELPIITLAEGGFVLRFLKVFWLLFVIPIGTFIFMYFYPSMEERSSEMRINQELPFATIHMAAISGSMIEPSKIFNIIANTGEYPYLSKEFTRLMNEINLYGYNLVTALKNVSLNSPSKKFSELLNGLATTISSGGNLPDFFEKRAESLLFDYKIEKEKYTKSAETFMDIYISVVIAAPMILMLLLVMMKISGLGLTISTGTITLITVLGVFLINIVFLGFLQLKQPKE